MIHQLKITNYKSLKNKTTFNFKDDVKSFENFTVVAGARGSSTQEMFEIIRFLQNFVLYSDQNDLLLKNDFFGAKSVEQNSTEFEIIFSNRDILIPFFKQKKYRYYVELKNGRILNECLAVLKDVHVNEGREYKIFTRVNDDIIYMDTTHLDKIKPVQINRDVYQDVKYEVISNKLLISSFFLDNQNYFFVDGYYFFKKLKQVSIGENLSIKDMMGDIDDDFFCDSYLQDKKQCLKMFVNDFNCLINKFKIKSLFVDNFLELFHKKLNRDDLRIAIIAAHVSRAFQTGETVFLDLDITMEEFGIIYEFIKKMVHKKTPYLQIIFNSHDGLFRDHTITKFLNTEVYFCKENDQKTTNVQKLF